MQHREFLDTAGEAPMRRFAETLIDILGEAGPILVYSNYERTVLYQLRKRFPDLEALLVAIISRLFDLHPLAKDYYYHLDMRGSWSLKDVLPTIAPELAYDNLGEVRDGGGAQDAYREIISSRTIATRKNALAADLRAYCYRDTLALVEIAHFFEGCRHAGGSSHGH